MNFNSAFGTSKGNHVVWTEPVKGLNGVILVVHSEENDRVWWCEAAFVHKNKSIAPRRIVERMDLFDAPPPDGTVVTDKFKEFAFQTAREKLHAHLQKVLADLIANTK